jgi:hypothetical protein
MTTLARRDGLESGGGKAGSRRLWPVVLLVAAVMAAVAPLYFEVLVMHARMAAAEQSVEKITWRIGASAVTRAGR